MNFKNILSLLLLIIGLNMQAQVVQSVQHLDLKKSSGYHTLLAAPDADNLQMIVFAADKDSIKALRYNSVLFFTDSLSAKRPDSDYEFMAGYSFAGDRNATVYWVNHDYKKIEAVTFDFNSKTTGTSAISIPFGEEEVLTTFSDNNAFYILALPEKEDYKNLLRVYAFTNGKYEVHTIDFAAFKLKSISGKELSLNNLLQQYSLQKVEVQANNALPDTAGKIKFYIVNGNMVLTLDHNAAYTQVFTIGLNNFIVSEKFIMQSQLNESAESNSYVHNGKLYQLKLNESQLALSSTDLESGQLVKSYTVNAADEVTFKNSPFFAQTGNQKPRELKNTEKFLNRVSSSSVALSVYQTPDDLFITAGGVKAVVNAGDAILGGLVIAAGGSADLADDLFDIDNTQLIFFEGLFDEEFEHRPFQPGLMAVDYLGQYMAAHPERMTLETIFPFRNDLVLGYYDPRAKQFILRKFTDDDL